MTNLTETEVREKKSNKLWSGRLSDISVRGLNESKLIIRSKLLKKFNDPEKSLYGYH